ncbi:MAG: methyl-accepting chemotaxis protein [Sideroxyarcus sp.]|nr:methyl-accepting chemotaxis protein [Sideroxyarcus sp.]
MFSETKVATRLYVLVAFFGGLLLAIGLLGLHGMGSARAGLETVYKDRVVPLRDLKLIADKYAVNIVDTSHKMRNGNISLEQGRKNIEDAQSAIKHAWDGYLATVLVARETELVKELKPLMAAADVATAKLLNIVKENNRERLVNFTVQELYPVMDPVSDKISELVEVQLVVAREEYDGASALYERNLVISVGTIALGLLAGAAVAVQIVRNLMRQLGGDPREVAAVVNTMAAGDFSHLSSMQSPAGSLLANAYRMQTRLRDMIVGVKDQAGQVGDMAHSLASSANQIAENVHHESDSVSSMAAAIEELSVSTTHISDQGTNAKRIATNSRSNAEEGAKVVNKTVAGLLETAKEIEAASGEVSRLGEDATHISDVVKVIKEIADQTNLLALNAAIEAARAGEQGRGFAVVADEVRKLAERTASATSEINQMSGKIGEVASHALDGMDKVVKTTRQGVGDAEIAQTSIRNIQTSFGEVSAVIDEIAPALEEQNAAASELAKSTERVSQMSEENSGAAHSLLNLANELEGKAGEMRKAVEVFKV